jgi:hypothetical protein
MHILMMSLYAAMTAVVLATVDPRATTTRDRFRHGLKTFAWFMGIGWVLSWVFFPIPW